MTINIHGKEYVTVAERVKMIHDELKEFSIITEVLPNGGSVIIKATVSTPKGIFTGISAANPNKPIEKMSPYEVAETSAVGRALGFAGYGVVDSISTADEIVKAKVQETESSETPEVKEVKTEELATIGQCKLLSILLARKGKTKGGIYGFYKIKSLKELTKKDVEALINKLISLPDPVDKVDEVDEVDKVDKVDKVDEVDETIKAAHEIFDDDYDANKPEEQTSGDNKDNKENNG